MATGAGSVYVERLSVEPPHGERSTSSGALDEPGSAERRRGSRIARTALAVAALVAGLLAGLGTSYAVDRQRAGSLVLWGVVAQGRMLAGADAARARRMVSELRTRSLERPLTVLVQGRRFALRARDAGLDVGVDETVRRALRAGREGGWIGGALFWFARSFTRYELPVSVRLDERTFAQRVAEWERLGIREKPFDGGVSFRGRLVAEYPRAGFVIDRSRTAELLRRAALDQSTTLEVPVLRREPRLERAHVDAALARAKKLCTGPIALETADGAHRVDFSEADLGAALTSSAAQNGGARLDLAFSPAVVARKLESLRATVERPARPASFRVDAMHRIEIIPSEAGVRIDDAAAARGLLEAAARTDRRAKVPLVVGELPALSTEQAHALGIKGLVSKFTTHHACCQPRVHNIHRIADLIDGVIVKPGETFSINEAIGERTERNGFIVAPGIADGEMEDTVGGGVSQFATTIFNAVLDGGYEIVRRQPHSYYFPRYPMGHEATVSYPEPDLIFRNDTRAGMLLKTEYGEKYIRVLIYGDNEGRKITLKVSPQFDITDPPVEYEPNERISPLGARRLTRGAVGWSVIATRTVRYADGRTAEQRRKVVYQPRPRRVEVHPCNIPKGKRGYTGEPCPALPGPDGGIAVDDTASHEEEHEER